MRWRERGRGGVLAHGLFEGVGGGVWRCVGRYIGGCVLSYLSDTEGSAKVGGGTTAIG